MEFKEVMKEFGLMNDDFANIFIIEMDKIEVFHELIEKRESQIDDPEIKERIHNADRYGFTPLKTRNRDWLEGHYREILDRVESDWSDEAMKLGTLAELMMSFSELSLAVPMNRNASCLYFYCFGSVFKDIKDPKIREYCSEDHWGRLEPYPGYIQEEISKLRRKCRVEGRKFKFSS